MRWLALAVLLAACTDAQVPMDGAVAAGDLAAMPDSRRDIGGEARADSTPDDRTIDAAKRTPDSTTAPTVIGSMSIKYINAAWTTIGGGGSSAMSCACILHRSKSTGTVAVACASSLVAKWCDPQNGAGWGIWFPGLPATSGTVKLTTGVASAKLWGAWGSSGGMPVPFSGDYAILVEAGAFPPSGLVALAAGKLSLTAQVMLRSQTDATKAVVVNIDLADAPLMDIP